MSTLADNLIFAFRVQLDESAVTQRIIAERVGISEKHLSCVLNGRSSGSLALWDQLFAALDCCPTCCGETPGDDRTPRQPEGTPVSELRFMVCPDPFHDRLEF